MIKQHPTEFPLDILSTKDDQWFRNRIRKYIVDSKVIKNDLHRVYQRYSSFEGLFKSRMKATHNSVIAQLAAGYLSDPEDVNVYFNISNDVEKPKYITVRGTSQLESLHYHIQKILSGPNCREETMHMVLTDRLYRWNMLKAKLNRKMDNVDVVYDPKLKCHIDTIREQLLLKKKYFVPMLNEIEGFGILRQRFSSEAFIASRSIFRSGMESNNDYICVRKGIIRPTAPITTDAEKLLYKILVEEYNGFTQMVLDWNQLILNAVVDKRNEVSVFFRRQEREVHLPVSELFLKDSRHFDLFAANLKKVEDVFRLY